jgi:hypothetical protein
VQFEVPNRMGTVVQVSGRGASVRDQEGTPDLCPVTRWVVGGGAGSQLDLDVPPAPLYALAASGGGNFTLSGVGFADLANTRSVTAGTLQVAYFDELQMPSPYTLSTALTAGSTNLALTTPLPTPLPQGLQIGSEVMRVLSFNPGTNTATVQRAQYTTQAGTYSSSAAVLPVNIKTFVVPFARDFFASPASQNFAHTIHLPDVRIVAAQFLMTNSRGNGPSTLQAYTNTADGGLRTCSGGQLSLQVGGYLATQQNAAPPLLVEAAHAVRDIRAKVTEAPINTNIVVNLWQNGTPYTSLTIPAGQTTSNIIDGKTLATLQNASTLKMDIVLNVLGTNASPGKDLTVTIRL